jgi:hypothetical protein
MHEIDRYNQIIRELAEKDYKSRYGRPISNFPRPVSV